ncbi:MAG: hypothetical protein ACQESE_04895, partial [Nanobdellota archaeon]
LASEGQEVEGVEDEEINIYTEFGDAIGSITIEDGFVRDIDCYRIHSEPSYEIEFDNYGVLNALDNNDLYSQSLDLMDQDRIKIKGVGFANSFKSFIGNNVAGLIN